MAEDFNGAAPFGTGCIRTTTPRERRWSSAAGYPNPPARENTRIAPQAKVEQILFSGKRTSDTVCRDGSGRRRAVALGGTIPCAGTFNSLQLQQLSGVGPVSPLAEHGIELANGFPGVGENLQDHPGIGPGFRSSLMETVNDLNTNPLRDRACFLRYLLEGPAVPAASSIASTAAIGSGRIGGRGAKNARSSIRRRCRRATWGAST